jgi:hypothetical protein
MSIQDNNGDTSKVLNSILRKAAKLVSQSRLSRTRWNAVSGQHPNRDWNTSACLGVFMVAKQLGLSDKFDADPEGISKLVGNNLQHQWLNMETSSDQRSRWLYDAPQELVGNLSPIVSKRYDMEVSPSRVRSMEHRSAFPRHIDEEMWELACWHRDQQETLEAKQRVFGMNVYEYIQNAPDVSYIVYNKCDQNGRIYADSRGELAPCYSKTFRAVFGGPLHHVDDATLAAFTTWCEREYGLPITDFCKLHTEAKGALTSGWSLVAIRHSRTLASLIDGNRMTQTLWEQDAAHSGETLIRAALGILKDSHCNTKNEDYVHSHKTLAFALKSRFPNLRMSYEDMKRLVVKPMVNRAMYGAGPIPVTEAYLGLEYRGEWQIPNDCDIMEHIPDFLKGKVKDMDITKPEMILKKIVDQVNGYLKVYHGKFPFIRGFNTKVREWLESQTFDGRIISSWDWRKQVCPYNVDLKASLNDDGVQYTGTDQAWNMSEEVTCFPWVENPLTGEGAGSIHMADSNVLCCSEDLDREQGILSDGIHDAKISLLGDGLQIQKNYRDAFVQVHTDPDQQLLVRMGLAAASNWCPPKLDSNAHLLA